MATIGDAGTARMLNAHYNGEIDLNKRAPKGFRKVGDGASRLAIVDKSTNVVYKIGDGTNNLIEAKVARRLRKKSTRNLGFELKIPHSRTYQVSNDYPHGRIVSYVGAQEFAANASHTYCAVQDNHWMDEKQQCNCKRRTPICFSTVHDRVKEFSGIEDIHGLNILVDRNSVFWLIDMADPEGEYSYA